MARPQRNNVDYFPKWNPNRKLLMLIDDYIDELKAFKAFRNSSSAFISRVDVRNYLLLKYNGICRNCKSSENIEIDHIKSVYYCFKNNLFHYCNTLDNLQLLCRKCNASKIP